LLPLVGFLPANDPRMSATIDDDRARTERRRPCLARCTPCWGRRLHPV